MRPVGLALVLAACSEAPAPAARPPYETLSAWGLFGSPIADLEPRANVIPYDVASPLWSDGAAKDRFIVLPEGETVGLEVDGDWDWPQGSVIIKSFSFERHVETRLLVLEEAGWTPYIYLWNDAQTEATRVVAGADVTVNGGQRYLVPNENQCRGCHARDDVMHLLGLVTRQVNREDQVATLAARGIFTTAPPDAATLPALVDPFGTAALDLRARSYLEANCAHCHQPGGAASRSGLTLLASEMDPIDYGVCKPPVAAGGGAGGRSADIVPGDPDDSIVPFRMASTDPEIKMPELPNLLPDPDGVGLVTEWIAGMTPVGCP